MAQTFLKPQQAIGSYLNAPKGFMLNGKISVLDASGITVALKTLAGNTIGG